MKTISLDGITYNLISEKEVAVSDKYINDGVESCSTLNTVREFLVKKIKGTHTYFIKEQRNIAGGTYFTSPEPVWC